MACLFSSASVWWGNELPNFPEPRFPRLKNGLNSSTLAIELLQRSIRQTAPGLALSSQHGLLLPLLPPQQHPQAPSLNLPWPLCSLPVLTYSHYIFCFGVRCSCFADPCGHIPCFSGNQRKIEIQADFLCFWLKFCFHSSVSPTFLKPASSSAPLTRPLRFSIISPSSLGCCLLLVAQWIPHKDSTAHVLSKLKNLQII